jgi:pheromone shutdown protein TraB
MHSLYCAVFANKTVLHISQLSWHLFNGTSCALLALMAARMASFSIVVVVCFAWLVYVALTD